MFPFPSSLTFKNLLEMGGMESIVHESQADVFIMHIRPAVSPLLPGARHGVFTYF